MPESAAQEISTALRVLRCTCHIESNVTLEDILHAVERDPELVRFLGEWSWCDVEACHLEARRPDATPSHLAYIEVGKRFRWGDENAYEETGIYGIGEPDDGTTHYGIELIPLNNLIHLPVRLRPQMQIFKDYQKLAEAPCTFTLLEILGGIYWEITSHGSPEERDKLRAELLESDRADNYQQTMNDET